MSRLTLEKERTFFQFLLVKETNRFIEEKKKDEVIILRERKTLERSRFFFSLILASHSCVFFTFFLFFFIAKRKRGAYFFARGRIPSLKRVVCAQSDPRTRQNEILKDVPSRKDSRTLCNQLLIYLKSEECCHCIYIQRG